MLGKYAFRRGGFFGVAAYFGWKYRREIAQALKNTKTRGQLPNVQDLKTPNPSPSGQEDISTTEYRKVG